MTTTDNVAYYGPADVCAAAAARGEDQLEAVTQFNAKCVAAIHSDPELHAEWLREAEMRQHQAENTPPSYDPAEMDDWVRGGRTDREIDDEERER